MYGGDGSDAIFMGAFLDSGDRIDGGSDGGGLLVDQVYLDGDYTGAGAVVFGATTMTNVESLTLLGGHSYDLTTNDATVSAVQQLEVDAHALGAGDSLTFDGSAESDGTFFITGGAGNDALTGGVTLDGHLRPRRYGGADTAYGGDGIRFISHGRERSRPPTRSTAARARLCTLTLSISTAIMRGWRSYSAPPR